MFLTGLKSFFGSFILSLFMIFSINSFFGAEKNTPSSLNLPKQNISLFVKNSPHSYQKSDKIALMKPLEAPVEALPLALPSEKITIQPVKADIKEKKDIPAALSKVTKTKKARANQKKTVVSKTQKPKLLPETVTVTLSEKVADKILLEQPQIKITANAHDKAAEQKIKTAELDTPSISEKVNTQQASPQNMPEAPLKPSLSEQKKAEIIQVASAEQPQSLDALLIPLEKDEASSAKSDKKINPPSAENQVAMSAFDKPVSAMINSEKMATVSDVKTDDSWLTMAEKHDEHAKARPSKEIYERPEVGTAEQESPWIAAKGTKFPDNTTVLEQDFYKNGEKLDLSADISDPKSILADDKSGAKVAGEVVNNILIPIPEDILNDKNLMPDLVSDPKNKPLEDELKLKEATLSKQTEEENISEIPFIVSEENKSKEEKESSGKSLFSSLTSLFSSSDSSEDMNAGKVQNDESGVEESSAQKSSAFDFLAKNRKKMKILPSEIRLSFQPDRAEISGKTLDWLKAFAQKAIENDDVALEIRIDGSSSYALQQKRLNLLYNILTNLGLGYAKVHTVFTAREPNSFILRAVKTSEDSNKKLFDPASSYYRR